MNVFHKVTLESLKKNKVRSIVTIIGIVLSTAMICAVTTFASSMQNYMLQGAIYEDGSWHGRVKDVSFMTYEEIAGNSNIKAAIYLQQLGYAVDEKKSDEYKPYLYVLGASEGTEKTLPIHMVYGDYPQSADEIILPMHLVRAGDGIPYALGDTLSLELGERIWEGNVMTQENPCYENLDGKVTFFEEEIVVRETRSYTIVGFFETMPFRIEDYSAPGFMLFTGADEEVTMDYQYDVYFEMKNPKDVYRFMEENDYRGQRNSNVLMYQGVSGYSKFSKMLYSLAAIVIGLIMFGSISLIYNAFSISVSERTKQFGLLSSIGATKKQLRKMVTFEALVVAAIGIPLGILSGIAGIGITLMLIGEKFMALGMPIKMELCVSWISVAAAVVVALVTVLISASIPSRRATKISAVEAIRQNTDIKVNVNDVKTPKWIYKIFGLSGMLASKYYRRNRRKYRTTVMSLFMSIVLFVSASAFTNYLMESVSGGFETDDYDLWYMGHMEEQRRDELLKLFESEEHVTDAAYIRSEYISGTIEDRFLQAGIAKEVFGEGGIGVPGMEEPTETSYHLLTYVTFVSDEDFKELLQEYHLSEDEFMNPENPLGIVVDKNTMFNRQEGRFETTSILNSDVCEIRCSEYKEFEDYHYAGEVEKNGEIFVQFRNHQDTSIIKELPHDEARVSYTLKAGKTIDKYPYFMSKDCSDMIPMIYPISFFDKVLPDGAVVEYDKPMYSFYIKSENHAVSYENLQELLIQKGFSSGSIVDYAASVESDRNLVLIIQVFSYGFIVLISLIAAANVFNTISTNISLRRREFAMLKSVGMTAKGFNQMMNYECLLYGSKALILGVPTSCLITYLIYRAIMSGYETTFRLPWIAMGIAVMSVFIVVFATMMYSMSKIKKDNPIDALKNENL